MFLKNNIIQVVEQPLLDKLRVKVFYFFNTKHMENMENTFFSEIAKTKILPQRHREYFIRKP